MLASLDCRINLHVTDGQTEIENFVERLALSNRKIPLSRSLEGDGETERKFHRRPVGYEPTAAVVGD